MVVIIDANILISSIINPEGKISKILVLSENVEFILPNYAWIEIEKHKNKICSAYKISPNLFDKIFLKLSSYFLIFSEREIETTRFEKALDLIASIDEKDAIYVAFALTLMRYCGQEI